MASELCPELLSWLVERLAEELGLEREPAAPVGIQVRRIAHSQYFYVNVTSRDISVPLERPGKGILSEKEYDRELLLKGYDAELIVTEEALTSINLFS